MLSDSHLSTPPHTHAPHPLRYSMPSVTHQCSSSQTSGPPQPSPAPTPDWPMRTQSLQSPPHPPPHPLSLRSWRLSVIRSSRQPQQGGAHAIANCVLGLDGPTTSSGDLRIRPDVSLSHEIEFPEESRWPHYDDLERMPPFAIFDSACGMDESTNSLTFRQKLVVNRDRMRRFFNRQRN